MSDKLKKNIFTDGPITSEMIAKSIAHHSTKHDIGAHSIFLGQVRADEIEGRKVRAIDYTCYREMANEVFHAIREEAFAKYDLTCMHIFHSLGEVATGEISLFVFTSSPHRRVAIDACTFVVEEIKAKAPVWGREIFEDDTYQWKTNT